MGYFTTGQNPETESGSGIDWVALSVRERIAGMSFADKREACDTYRYQCKIRGHKPYGYSFSEWLQDRIANGEF